MTPQQQSTSTSARRLSFVSINRPAVRIRAKLKCSCDDGQSFAGRDGLWLEWNADHLTRPPAAANNKLAAAPAARGVGVGRLAVRLSLSAMFAVDAGAVCCLGLALPATCFYFNRLRSCQSHPVRNSFTLSPLGGGAGGGQSPRELLKPLKLYSSSESKKQVSRRERTTACEHTRSLEPLMRPDCSTSSGVNWWLRCLLHIVLLAASECWNVQLSIPLAS